MIDFVDYEVATRNTAIYPESGTGSYNALVYVALGLTNEAGEVAGKLKKVWRDDGGILTDEKRDAIAAELGDVLWYLARAADELGIGFDVVAKDNLAKLSDRKARGVISGSGDTR